MKPGSKENESISKKLKRIVFNGSQAHSTHSQSSQGQLQTRSYYATREPKQVNLSVYGKYVKRAPANGNQPNQQTAHSLMLDTSLKDLNSVGTNSILNSPLITRKIQKISLKNSFQKPNSPTNSKKYFLPKASPKKRDSLNLGNKSGFFNQSKEFSLGLKHANTIGKNEKIGKMEGFGYSSSSSSPSREKQLNTSTSIFKTWQNKKTNLFAVKQQRLKNLPNKTAANDLRKKVLMKLRDRDNRSKSVTSGNYSGNSSSSKNKKSKKSSSKTSSNRDKNSTGSLFSQQLVITKRLNEIKIDNKQNGGPSSIMSLSPTKMRKTRKRIAAAYDSPKKVKSRNTLMKQDSIGNNNSPTRPQQPIQNANEEKYSLVDSISSLSQDPRATHPRVCIEQVSGLIIDTPIKTHCIAKRVQKKPSFNFSKRKISDFKLGKLLGRGRTGEVYLAKDIPTGMMVAIKKLKKVACSMMGCEYSLVREIKIHLTLNHSHILRLFGYFSDEKHIYLVMEAASEGSLYDLIKKAKKSQLTPTAIMKIMKQLLEALSYLEKRKIVHRDLKPENVLISLVTLNLA